MDVPAPRPGSAHGPAASGPARRSRPALAAAMAALCLAGITVTFWLEDWRYALPTRVPADHVPVRPGDVVPVPDAVAALVGERRGRPLLLHFFNPRCPCSRFNLEHLRALVRDLDGAVDFVLVHERGGAGSEPAPLEGLDLPAVVDADGSIADRYGVYSTPVAAVVDGDGAVAYVGNYTPSRYCVDPAKEYVRLVLEALAAGRAVDVEAARGPAPYGCPLPSDRQSVDG